MEALSIIAWKYHPVTRPDLARGDEPYSERQRGFIGKCHRVLYSSWNSTAVSAAIQPGFAITVLPESARRHGMRLLGDAEGFPALPQCEIGLLRSRQPATPVSGALVATSCRRSTISLRSMDFWAAEPFDHCDKRAVETA